MDLTGHESEDRLELYALGRLPDSDSVQIEEHLFLCSPCREKLDGVGDFALTMRSELEAHPLPERKSFFEWLNLSQPRFALAGAFAVVLLALGVYWIRPSVVVAPMASLQLTAMRGEMRTVGTAKELDLTITDAPTQSGPFRMEVVDGSGSPIWKGIPDTVPAGLELKLKDRLSPGDYFVRLYSAGGELLHEYGFHVRG